MPKVSIIVPNYNYCRYLPQRLDSIFNQTFTDYEVILLDDCSTDDSQSVLRQYASHPKVSHIVLNERNTGSPFAQWEKGIALAQGEYLWIAESDDYCSNDFLEHSVKALDENPQVGYTLCGSYIVDENGDIQNLNYDPWPMGADNGKVDIISSTQYLKGLLYHSTAYNSSMIVFRRKTYCSIQDRGYAKMRYCGDWMFWIKMAELSDVALRHERSNYYRRHGKCVTIAAQKEKRLKESLLVFCYLWQQPIFSKTERCISKGYVYKEIIRAEISKEQKEIFLMEMGKYGVNKRSYILERIAKLLFPRSKH